jgi:uncharacterized damage-inducible protein DinB
MRPVPEYDPKAWLMKALRETAHAMEALVWDIDEEILDRLRTDGDWSVRALMLHMCEMERRYVERLELVVRLDEPRIQAFDGDSIETREEYTQATVFELMDEFGAYRQRSVHLLWSLDDADWDRRGIHPYLGPLTILEMAREMNEHDLSRLWQLRRICDSLVPAIV